jgi:hypothetical protein
MARAVQPYGEPISRFCELLPPENVVIEDWFNMRKSSAAILAWLIGFCCIAFAGVVPAADGTGAQRAAAEEYLVAVAAGDARAMALSIHGDELEALRKRLLDEMKLEADRGDSLLRTRLFGGGMPLAEIERLTPQGFFVTLSPRLRFSGRAFESVDWLAAVPDSGGMVQMVGRLRPPKEMGAVRVPVLVSLIPWGKDWKAALPLELQAQIDDLRTGRVRAGAPAVVAGGGSAAASAAPAVPAVANANPQAILDLLQAAEENLVAARCATYYDKQMSPNFRRTTAVKALRSLVSACENREVLRGQLLGAVRLARTMTPRYEYAGNRAIYDLSGQGLPFSALVLEQVDKRWYIAE